MKNESRFSDARKAALRSIMGMAAALAGMAAKPLGGYRWSSGRMARAKPKNNPAGGKLYNAAQAGTLGMGRHTNTKHPIDGVTFSPKVDIGKGPQFTRSVRGVSKGYMNQHIQRNQQEFAARTARSFWHTESSINHGSVN